MTQQISLGEHHRPVRYEIDGNYCHICISHAKDKDGYPKASWEGRPQRIANILYKAKCGPLPKGVVLRHICDNAACINIEHLVQGTHKQNVEDRVQRKRSAKGERNGRAKLTSLAVKEIRSSKESITTLAKRLGVSRKLILRILRGEIWKEI